MVFKKPFVLGYVITKLSIYTTLQLAREIEQELIFSGVIKPNSPSEATKALSHGLGLPILPYIRPLARGPLTTAQPLFPNATPNLPYHISQFQSTFPFHCLSQNSKCFRPFPPNLSQSAHILIRNIKTFEQKACVSAAISPIPPFMIVP